MPTFTLTLPFRGDEGQKSYWEGVVEQLRKKGARIINIQSRSGKVGDPPTKVNVVTVTYEAAKEIKYKDDQP